ncbi:MAG: hypothetical protein ABJE95_27550 [Byssovorax sp.]
MSPRVERHLSPVRRARLRGQRRRALERARRAVLRRGQVQLEVREILVELSPVARVRALEVERGVWGWEVRFQRALLVWRGGRRA